MTQRELEEILGRGNAKHVFISCLEIEGAPFNEKRTAEVFDPADGQSKTINIERRGLCALRHVLSEANPPVARCFCGALICGTPECLQHCAQRGCHLAICAAHRWSIKAKFFCPRHALMAAIRLILGF